MVIIDNKLKKLNNKHYSTEFLSIDQKLRTELILIYEVVSLKLYNNDVNNILIIPLINTLLFMVKSYAVRPCPFLL